MFPSSFILTQSLQRVTITGVRLDVTNELLRILSAGADTPFYGRRRRRDLTKASADHCESLARSQAPLSFWTCTSTTAYGRYFLCRECPIRGTRECSNGLLTSLRC